MEISTVLVARLRELSGSIGDDETQLTGSITSTTNTMLDALLSRSHVDHPPRRLPDYTHHLRGDQDDDVVWRQQPRVSTKP